MSSCKQSRCYLNLDTPQQSWLLIITALFFIADLFFGCFLYWARCSFMSATKSVFICAGRPLALLHTVLSSLEMKTRHNNFVSKAYSVKSLCQRIGSVRKTLMLHFLSIWLPPIHISYGISCKKRDLIIMIQFTFYGLRCIQFTPSNILLGSS